MDRIISIIFAIGSSAVLALSMILPPNPLGHSTHTAIGLHGCTFLRWTELPCPMCGMTTSFSLFGHFRPIDALINQPFSVVMYGITLLVFAISFAESVKPAKRWQALGRKLAPYEAKLAFGFLVFMGVGWVYKIALMQGWLGF